MIQPILFLLAVFGTTALVIALERRAMKRRVQAARTTFAQAYDAWQRGSRDPYTGDVPALYAAAEKAGWNLAARKGRSL